MASMLKRLILAIGALSIAAVQVHAAELLVVTRQKTGVWTVESAESMSINGGDRVRLVSAAAGGPATWDSKSVGRLIAVNLEKLSVLRRAPDGAIFARQGASPEWMRILPDNSKIQAPETAAQLWARASITVKREKKDKTTAPIAADEMYAVIPTSDPGATAAGMASETEWHAVPGVDAGQAFRNRVEMLPAAAKAFPGPPAERIREHVRSSMEALLKTWVQGDAEIGALDQCAALAAASESAFAADLAQTDLRKQVRDTRQALERCMAILRALDAGEQADAFLLAYREFEPYDKSFPDLSAARRKQLTAAAGQHALAGEVARKAGDFAEAIRQFRIALWRDPQLAAASAQLETVRLEVARLSAQQTALARRGIDPRAPAQVQLQRRLLLADQYIADNKPTEAQSAIGDAEKMDAGEPKIRLLEAKLAVQRGELGSALALLDLYAGLAITQADFEEGEKLRASVEYRIASERKGEQAKLAQQTEEQQFASALEGAAAGLKLDNEDPTFLYHSGVQACVLRQCEKAAPLLRRFLDITDSTAGRRNERITTMRLLDAALRPQQEGTKNASRTHSWFSGAPLGEGSLYDPVSLAFQPKAASVKGSKGLTVAYEWGGDGLLKSVHTRYEDKKTGTNLLKLAMAGAAASQGTGSTVGWRTADRETNDFYFSYYDELPQVLRVDRQNQVTKSRTIPISIPGVGFGGIGALGALGSLGGAGALGGLAGLGRTGTALPGLSGMSSALGASGGSSFAGTSGVLSQLGGSGGFGGLAGFGGVGGSGALRALLASQAAGGSNSLAMLSSMGLGGMGQLRATQDTRIHADLPPGASSSGYLTLWNSPRLDTQVAQTVTGKSAATVFSGNSYFHPFVWDAIHLFDAEYDEQGRMIHATETDKPGAPRLDFEWDGRLLRQIVARQPGGSAVYTRSMQYANGRLMSEVINYGGKASKIQYKYDKQGQLTEAEADDDASLDGRSRRIEFVQEGNRK